MQLPNLYAAVLAYGKLLPVLLLPPTCVENTKNAACWLPRSKPLGWWAAFTSDGLHVAVVAGRLVWNW